MARFSKFSVVPKWRRHCFGKVTLSGGASFLDVGFNYGTGFVGIQGENLLFELYDGATLVLSGQAPLDSSMANYIGFSGRGFDSIIVRDDLNGGPPVQNGSYQALAIDNIEIRGRVQKTPDHGSTIALLGAALTGVVLAQRTRN